MAWYLCLDKRFFGVVHVIQRALFYREVPKPSCKVSEHETCTSYIHVDLVKWSHHLCLVLALICPRKTTILLRRTIVNRT